MRKLSFTIVSILGLLLISGCATIRPPASQIQEFKAQREKEYNKAFAAKFAWWPSDATPKPYKDPERDGYWWWPRNPGSTQPWGNRGYVYVRKIIFDEQGRPQIIIKRIERNVNIYFDFDKSNLREDAQPILADTLTLLAKDRALTLLLSGHADVRGTEEYNQKLGQRRAEEVREYLLANGVRQSRIKIISRGKLDAVAPATDIVGLQKDRKVHFVLAEIEEITVPESEKSPYGDKAVIEEIHEIETPVKVEIRKYVIQKNDSLWKIAEHELGNGGQWRRLYEFNRARIGDPQHLKPGEVLEIPVE